VNWEKMKEDLDAAVRQQSVAVLDEAIGHLVDMRNRLLAGERNLPPPTEQPATDPVLASPVPSAPLSEQQPEPVPDVAKPAVLPVRPRQRARRDYPPRTCEQCGTVFTPDHWKTKICSDECRERRAMNRKNGINMTFKRTEPKTDTEAVEQEIKARELAEKFAPRHTRRDAGSNPQAAPRIKKPVQHLPPYGGPAEPGSPEAAAAIERVKADGPGAPEIPGLTRLVRSS
jgi:hypothetical protein